MAQLRGGRASAFIKAFLHLLAAEARGQRQRKQRVQYIEQAFILTLPRVVSVSPRRFRCGIFEFPGLVGFPARRVSPWLRFSPGRFCPRGEGVWKKIGKVFRDGFGARYQKVLPAGNKPGFLWDNWGPSRLWQQSQNQPSLKPANASAR